MTTELALPLVDRPGRRPHPLDPLTRRRDQPGPCTSLAAAGEFGRPARFVIVDPRRARQAEPLVFDPAAPPDRVAKASSTTVRRSTRQRHGVVDLTTDAVAGSRSSTAGSRRT